MKRQTRKNRRTKPPRLVAHITGSAGIPAGEFLPTLPETTALGAPRAKRDKRDKNAKSRQIATRESTLARSVSLTG
jgi:hypothetical protein